MNPASRRLVNTRRLLAALATLLLADRAAVAQESFLPQPLDEIETIIELLDAVDAAELKLLSGDELSGEELDQLAELGRIGDTIGATDLAARARSLLILARPRREEVELQPTLNLGLLPPVDRELVRGSDEFRTLSYIFAATGATALALSGGFYALAEREYQLWRVEEDPTVGAERFQAWRGYDFLSLGLGATALASGGVAIPLLYGLADAPDSRALTLARGSFTREERDQHLLALYAERAELVERLNALETRAPVASTASTTGLVTGLVGAVTSVTMFYFAGELYDEYLVAPFSPEAEVLGNQVRLFDTLAIVAGSLSAAGFGTALGLEILTENRAELESALRDVNRDIIELRTATLMEEVGP